MADANIQQLQDRVQRLEAELAATTKLFVTRFEKIEGRAMLDADRAATLQSAIAKIHRDGVTEEAAARIRRERAALMRPAVVLPVAPLPLHPARLSTNASIRIVADYLLHHEEARRESGKINWTSLARLHPERNNRAWASFYHNYSDEIDERVTAGRAVRPGVGPAA